MSGKGNSGTKSRKRKSSSSSGKNNSSTGNNNKRMFSGSRRSSSNRGSSSRGGYFSSSHHQPVVSIDVAGIEKMFADIADETNDQIATMEGMYVCLYHIITL